MSTACDNFRPHMWKPGQCAACFRSKAEHAGASSDVPVPTKTPSTVTAKRTPYYRKLSSQLDEDVTEVKPATTNTAQKEDKTIDMNGEVSTQQSADVTSSSMVESQKPKSDNEVKTNNQRSDSPAGQSPFVSSGESGTSDTSLADSMSQQVVRPTARVRSQTMGVPRVKPRRNAPQPFVQGLDLASSGTTKTLPHGLSVVYPVPPPRRSHTLDRSNKSASPAPLDDGKAEEVNIVKAKSLDNLDAVPTKRTHPKVTFKSETVTIPDPSTASSEQLTTKKTAAVAPVSPRSGKKVAAVQPYAVSEVTDILEKKSAEVAKVEKKEEDDSDHEYIEADEINAAVVSVNELKTQKTLQRNGGPPHMTKYATLSSVQPSRMDGIPKRTIIGGKQKAASSGAILTRQKTSPQLRRRPPPPPVSKVTKTRSKSVSNEDERQPQDYTLPRRPPPPLVYSNHEVKNMSNVTAKAPAVNKVPPTKPARSPSTFQVESPTGVISDDVFEDDDVKSPSADSTLLRPKKPVRMPRDATPPQNSTAPSSDEPPLRGRYADLDIDKLEADQALLKLVGQQQPIMKYENFDDFSPPPVSQNEQPAVDEDDDEREYSSIAFDGSGQVHDVIIHTLNIACGELTKLYFETSTFMGTMMCSKWSDLQAAPSDTRHCVRYNGRLFSVQDFDKDRADNEKLISSHLPPHPNVCRALAFFTENPPSKLNQKIKIKKGSNRVLAVTDHIPSNSVADFVKQKISSMEPVEYDRHVLLILVQLFSALKHLHSNGIVHRDLSVDTCRYDLKSSTLKVNDFTYALQRPLPLSSSTFLYGYSEIKWLGGTGSKLPPEIINTPEDCQILDYSLSDCFAAGCVIYEMFNIQVPFDLDERLIYKSYTKDDLPHIPQRSQYSELVDWLTYLLLQADTSKRINPQTALLLTQTILWAPVSWIHGTVTEGEILNFMAVEKARVVSAIAQNAIKGDQKPSIELTLKNIFLQECNPTALLKALPLLKLE